MIMIYGILLHSPFDAYWRDLEELRDIAKAQMCTQASLSVSASRIKAELE